MGSGSSVLKNEKKINCPNNYNESNFYKILDLFDKLKNSEIDDNKLFNISNTHNEELIKKLEDEKIKVLLCEQKKLLVHKLNLEHHIRILQSEYDANIKKTKKICQIKKKSLEQRILKLETCTNEEKKNLFLEKIKKNDTLDFEKFFNYMKDKTHTIESINWVESKKINRIRQQRLSINITTPNLKNTVTP